MPRPIWRGTTSNWNRAPSHMVVKNAQPEAPTHMSTSWPCPLWGRQIGQRSRSTASLLEGVALLIDSRGRTMNWQTRTNAPAGPAVVRGNRAALATDLKCDTARVKIYRDITHKHERRPMHSKSGRERTGRSHAAPGHRHNHSGHGHDHLGHGHGHQAHGDGREWEPESRSGSIPRATLPGNRGQSQDLAGSDGDRAYPAAGQGCPKRGGAGVCLGDCRDCQNHGG